MEDDEYAEEVLDEVERAPLSGPSLDDWSTEAAYLAAVVDRLGEVVAAIVGSAGGKPPKIKPLPRPRTAFDRARRRRQLRAVDSLVAEVKASQERRSAR